MKVQDEYDLSWDEWDGLQRPTPDTIYFDNVVDAAISQRGFLVGVLAYGSGSTVMGTYRMSGTSVEVQTAGRFGFTLIPIQTDGTVHVPEGYI